MHELKNQKKILFYFILVVFPFFLLAILEMSLRLFSFGDDMSLFVPSPDPRYYQINRAVGKRFFSRFERSVPTPLAQYFFKDKPVNGYRIFVLGESTVEGFPYDQNLAFPKILEKGLQDAFPDRKIEVINLGMTAINSYALLDFADEILQQKPDAVLIYTGHNEYYGALGVASMENGAIPNWMKTLRLKLVHLRTYQLLERAVVEFYGLIHPTTNDEAKATLMEKIVGRDVVPYQSELYMEGLKQFSDNMGALLAKFKDANVPVIISDLMSNVRDLPPFRSIHYGTYPPADSMYAEAKRLDASHVVDKARADYLESKDLDVIRFRAPEDLNNIIAHLADSLGIYCVSLDSLFENSSPDGIVGDNLMIDHLHPNIDGYFLMAEGFLNALREHGMIERSWDSTRLKPWTYYRSNWGFTELDSMIAVVRIKHLKAGWPFKPENTVNNFRNTYEPKGIIDSLAFMTIKYVDVSPIVAHKKLAAYYESVGDLNHASREYLSLAYSSPLDISSYYFAADLAFKAQDYADAIRYLRESPGSDTSSYAQFTIASIYSTQKKDQEALASIDKLENLDLGNNILLQVQKLKYKVQMELGLNSDARKTLALIKNMDPSFNEADTGKSQVILIPNKIRPYIEKAEVLRRNGRFSDALVVLKEANSIREIPYTDLLIGKILFAQRNVEALSYLEKAHKEIKEDPSLAYGLCALYLIKGDVDKAKAALNDFARLQGEDNPQYKQLKIVLEKKISERE